MIRLLSVGHIPRHVAFIMDGNRRFADKIHAERLVGHERGFDKLTETISWLFDLGITDTTIYAFSIENFKRPPEEVEGLMNLFRKQIEALNDDFERLESYQVRVRVYGNLQLMPADIRKQIARVELSTAKFSRFNLNVALAYTAREEITNAINELGEAVELGLLAEGDINDQALASAMYSAGVSNPDIVVRTSGETRLSDFLLWQSSFSLLAFVDQLWPDFTIWNLFQAVLRYQLDYNQIQRAKLEYEQKLAAFDQQECCQLYKEYRLRPRINGDRDKPYLTFEQFVELRRQRIEQIGVIIQRLKESRSSSHQANVNNNTN